MQGASGCRAVLWRWGLQAGGCLQAPDSKQHQASGFTEQNRPGARTRCGASQAPARPSESLWPWVILQFYFLRSGVTR